ncbi:Ycf66 family protein [Gloeocapsopsis crepidinum LEGE 06123]|uniref:Ycf66 family protein n=1 Tax=Gloeocapsopsis crepidinum LEGE 06123 TaxID=588587 RepID=A0ABR9UQJ0_9CHRO|nr:Ycf66 family protein [Gloeocapsopsis crepidinum]MBE9190318.1 Ycf66 family protein [Gloeocapsopsis crepidinum LEGE 06123]
MLAYILALAVGFFSLAIYMTAFFFPEVHRKGDFIWSGVGLFYALVLWVCSGRITGGVLLGQVAGVALLGWSVTQTLLLRRQLTPHLLQTAAPSAEEVKNTVQEKVSKSSFFSKLSQLTKRGSNSAATAKDRLQQLSKQAQSSETATSSIPATSTNNSIEIIDNRSSTPATSTSTESTIETVSEVSPDAPTEEPQIAESTAASVTESIPDASEEVEDTLIVDATATETISESDELVRPNPPEPELIDAALKDAEEKHQEAAPPEPEAPENPSPS